VAGTGGCSGDFNGFVGGFTMKNAEFTMKNAEKRGFLQ
jgi:hypothetical protein